METKEYMNLLWKAVEAVKRLSSQGNIDKLKEAKDHVEVATELIYGIVADVLGLEPEEKTSSRSIEMVDAIKAGREIVDSL